LNITISSRIEDLEHNEKNKKIIIASVIAFLVIIFIGGIILGAKKVLLTQETQKPETLPVASLTEIPETVQGKIDYLNMIILNSQDPSKTSFSVSTKIDVPDKSISVRPDNGKLAKVLNYIKKDMLSKVISFYPGKNFEFGKDFSSELIPVAFTQSDVLSADCGQGRIDEDGRAVDEDFYFLSFRFKESAFPDKDEGALYRSFNLKGKQKILDNLKVMISPMAEVKNCSIVCSSFRIEAKVSRLTDKPEYINYIRGYDFELTLRFKGDFAELGTRKISFFLTSTDKCRYSWAGLSLDTHELCLEKGGTEIIKAFKTPEENVSIAWSSSDENIATVDEDGYVKGRSISKEPVKITASFKYLGHQYSDSCEVYVIKSVSSIKVSQKELRLKLGESARLSAVVSPKRATIQDVLWFSDDEAAVACVDKNGNVSAKGAGETTVYALSAQGYYKSCCKVIVTQ
jgi:hypothetical protein